MAQQTIAYLKSRFETGKKPTAQDFADVFDSYVHASNLSEANNTAIDARISDYNSNIRQLSGSGAVQSLGDLLDVFVGYDSASRLKTVLDNIGGAPSWGSIQSRPERVDVTWEEVQVSLDTYVANNQPTPPSTSMGVINPVSIATGVGLIAAGNRTVIRDMQVTFFRVKIEGSSFTTFAQRINSVTFGVEPRVSLS